MKSTHAIIGIRERYTRFPALLALLATVALTGCGLPEQISLDPAQTPAIKTIGVLTPAAAQDADVLVLFDPLRGGLIGIALQARRNATLRGVIADQHFSIRDEFLSKLQDALRAKGLFVMYIPVARPDRDFLSHYPAAPTGVDALLDTRIGIYGYIAPNLDTSDANAFVPLLELHARLVDAKTSATLMQRTVEENPFFTNAKIVHVQPASPPRFGAVSDIRKNPAEVVAGLRQAADEAAEAVAKLMR